MHSSFKIPPRYMIYSSAVDGFDTSIELTKQGERIFEFDSWVARISHQTQDIRMAKSFGSEKRARAWISEMMQYPALIILKYGC